MAISELNVLKVKLVLAFYTEFGMLTYKRCTFTSLYLIYNKNNNQRVLMTSELALGLLATQDGYLK